MSDFNDPNIGKELAGRYIIRSHLGAGGMGSVYLAQDLNLNRAVAIKLLSVDIHTNEDLKRRFDNEAKAIAKLNHPNIIAIYDYQPGTSEHAPFFAMKYLRGGTLKDRVKGDERYSIEAAAELVNKIASALQYCHVRDIVHRDIKPSNIMFDEEGEPYLVDFGIIKDLGGGDSTMATGLIGTAEYMAPEQVLHAQISGATDQYALAIMIYQILTGRLPYQVSGSEPGTKKSDTDGSYSSYFEAHVKGKPLDITQMRRDMPGELMVVLGKALEKEPEKRYPTISAFASAFENAAFKRGAPPRIKPAKTPRPLPKFLQDPRGIVIGVVILLLIVIMGLIALLAKGAADDDRVTETETAVAWAAEQATADAHATYTVAAPITLTAQAELQQTAVQEVLLATSAMLGATSTTEAQMTLDVQSTLDSIATSTQVIINAQGTSTAVVATDNAASFIIAQTATSDAATLQLTLDARQTQAALAATEAAIQLAQVSTETAQAQITHDAQATLEAQTTATAEAAQRIAAAQQARSTALVQQTLDVENTAAALLDATQSAQSDRTATAESATEQAAAEQAATLTAQPTATTAPSATRTPVPTRTDVPTETSIPTDTDEPSNTPAESPSPTATDTVIPTATNTPTPTATDTVIPTATNTPTPTATATTPPTETPAPFRGPRLGQSVFLYASQAEDGASFDLFQINADGTERLPIIVSPADESSPAISPDGDQVAYISGTGGVFELFVANVDGSEVRQLTTFGGVVEWPIWSPDGRKIAFSARATPDDLSTINIINADGSNLLRLTSADLNARRPFFSPNGRQIAFEGGIENSSIYVMSADGMIIEQMTDDTGQDIQPAWSPDGDSIVFVSDRDGENHLFLLNLDSGEIAPLGTETDVFSPSFIRDGSAILYCAPTGPNATSELMLLNLATLTRTDVTNDAWIDTCPSGVTND